MTPREIIAQAWLITKEESQLRLWGFTSSFLQTLLSAKLLGYQSWFFYLYFIKGETIGFFAMEELFLEYMPASIAWTIIISLLVLVGIELIFPHFAKGAIIGLAAKAHTKQEVRGGLVLALYNFLPIFVVHEFFVLSGVSTVITIASLMIRYGPPGDFLIIPLGFLLFLFVFSMLFKFMAAFSEEAIVIHKMGTFAAMGRSIKLIVSHLNHIVFLLLLLFVISLRILANAVMIFLFPALIIGLGLLLTLVVSQTASILISGIVGLILLLILSYFFAYLQVFQQTVWTITYLELNKLKDLDVIDE